MRVGLIGCGSIAELRARALDGREGRPVLAAATDIDPGRARRFGEIHRIRVEGSTASLVAAPDIDAIVVSTPPAAHSEAVQAALLAGKPVLCEKPLAADAATARLLVREALARGVVLMCGFNHRFFPAVEWVRQAIASGRIGVLDRVRAFAGHAGARELGVAWLTDPAVVGGGALMDNGIHVLDLVRHLAGEIAEVAARTSSRVYGFPVEEDGVLQMLTVEGRIAVIEASWTHWGGYQFWVEAHGDRGVVRASYAPMRATLVERNDRGRAIRRFRIFPAVQIAELIGSWRSTVVSTFRRELAEFARIASGGRPDVAATGEDGARAVEIVAAAYESARTGQVVACAPVDSLPRSL
jgi:predicted dehydrogenase